MHNARMPFRRPDSLLPLTPISFEIILALLEGDRHGYAILQAVEARLAGTLPLRTGTMYRALARLLDEELIERVEGDTAADDPRRRYYRITAHGRTVAKAEARRLADQVEAARAHKLIPGTRR
jgi:DNA-binding PadR family transcriptional regulator